MCGIAGRLERSGREADRVLLERMTRSMEHRGPDEEGFHFRGALGLGHRRLAVIDLETGRQPLSSEDGKLRLIVNGEIFNFAALRSGLERRGHRFRTRGDSEVILHLYEERGPECLEELRGMFALALWDEPRETLFLARDRLGEKPLFYACTDTAFSFASEAQALLEAPDVSREIDFRALDAFLALQYVPAPLSIYRGARKLPAAHYLLLRRGEMTVRRYWRPDFNRKTGAGRRERRARVESALEEAVSLRLVSDVSLGAFLSGGIDSGTVVALMGRAGMRRARTFTVGFGPGPSAEIACARSVARFFGTDHHEIIVRLDIAAELPVIAGCYGEPFGDSSAIPTYFLCREARKEVTVALSGDGGDENFAGYPRYLQALRLEKIIPLLAPAARLPAPRGAAGGRAGWVLREAPLLDQEARYRRWLTVFTAAERRRLYRPGHLEELGGFYAGGTGSSWARPRRHLDRMAAADLECYLPDCLQVKMDVASMAHGLEVRSPFLDHRLVEAAAALPPGDKIARGRPKRLLREMMSGTLPPEVLGRAKQGFSPPLDAWLRGPGAVFLRGTLLGRRSLARGYFEPARVRALVEEHGRGRSGSGRVYLLLMLELWHRAHVD